METSHYKWFLISLLSGLFFQEGNFLQSASGLPPWGAGGPHPFHVSVTEINHNATDKTLEITCKLFTDDFENAIARHFKTKADLIKPADKEAMDKLVQGYVLKNLSLKADGRPVSVNWLGFENDGEATWCYFEAVNIPVVKKLEISNTLLYDLFTDQSGIIHVIVDGKRKSSKLDYPNKVAVFEF